MEERVSIAEQLGSLLQQGYQDRMNTTLASQSPDTRILFRGTLFSASRTYLAIQMGCAIADL